MQVSGQRHVLVDIPPEKKPGSHWVGGLVLPRYGLNMLKNRGLCCLCQDIVYDIFCQESHRFTA